MLIKAQCLAVMHLRGNLRVHLGRDGDGCQTGTNSEDTLMWEVLFFLFVCFTSQRNNSSLSIITKSQPVCFNKK